jgi:hypothetical protein
MSALASARSRVRRAVVAVARKVLGPEWRALRARLVRAVIAEMDGRVGQVGAGSQIELVHAHIQELRETLQERTNAQIDAMTQLLRSDIAALQRRLAELEAEKLRE